MHKKMMLAMAISTLCGCVSLEPMQVQTLDGYSYGEYTENSPPSANAPQSQNVPSAPMRADATMINGTEESYQPAPMPADTSVSQDPVAGQDYEMGGVSEDGQSYYPAGVAAEPVIAPPVQPPTPSSDGGQATLDQALAAGKEESWGTMIMLLEQAGNEGSAKANYLLAKHYTKGDVVPKDLEKADIYLDLASRAGYVDATRVQAWNLLLAGKLDEGKVKMEQAATTGARAQRDLGMLYLGLYKPNLNDLASGQHYLQLAYANGDAEAAYQLSKQLGSTPQGQQALFFAANSGHPKALTSKYQVDFKNGDKPAAKNDLEKVALTGDTDAMFTLANGINLGQLPSADKDQEAYLWFSIAKAKGNALATDELVALKGVKTLADRKAPGALDNQINQLMAQIKPWSPNEDD